MFSWAGLSFAWVGFMIRLVYRFDAIFHLDLTDSDNY